jgi:hypothetical protein
MIAAAMQQRRRQPQESLVSRSDQLASRFAKPCSNAGELSRSV